MNLHISKSKNAESFYICKSYVKANGSTSSMIVRKLGTLEQLLIEHGPTMDDILTWAKNEVKIETEKYKKEKEEKTVLIECHSDNLFATAGLPAIVQALWFYAASLKVINSVDISSRIIADSKAIAKCFVIYIYITHFF